MSAEDQKEIETLKAVIKILRNTIQDYEDKLTTMYTNSQLKEAFRNMVIKNKLHGSLEVFDQLINPNHSVIDAVLHVACIREEDEGIDIDERIFTKLMFLRGQYLKSLARLDEANKMLAAKQMM